MSSTHYESLKESVWTAMETLPNRNATIVHLNGVAELCALIGIKRGLDVEICRTAGILHDVWLFCHMPLSDEAHARHGYVGSEFAREFLAQHGGYVDGQMDVIFRMIYHHNDKQDIHDEYAEALKDADALQHYLNDSACDRKYRYYGRDQKLLREFIGTT